MKCQRDNCNNEVIQNKGNTKKFCSKNCFSSAKAKRFKENHPELKTKFQIICEQCQKIALVAKQTNIFCSSICRTTASRKYLTIPECLAGADRKVDKNLGYVRVYCPMHPEKNTRGYVYEHRLVAEQTLGRRLVQSKDPNLKEIVHHKNGMRWDNRPSNLEVMTVTAHGQLHGQHEHDLLDIVDPKTLNVDLSNVFEKYKHIPKVKKAFEKCKNQNCNKSVRSRKQIFCSKQCRNSTLKIAESSKELLEKLVLEIPMTKIGKQLGITDNAAKKRCKKLGITFPSRGFWAKVHAGHIKQNEITKEFIQKYNEEHLSETRSE